jgi:DNA-binding NtrC family response regulator
MTTPSTVLFVDDEERILRSLRMLFRGRYEVLTTTSGREAIEWVSQRRVHVVVSDQRMPEMGGVEVLKAVARRSPSTMRILLTGYADMDAVSASVNEGEIFRFVEKPWHAPYLINIVEKAAALATLEFAAPVAPARSVAAAPSVSPLIQPAAHVLALDQDRALATLVRDLLPGSVQVHHATSVEAALEILATLPIAIVVAHLTSAKDDVSAALKELKHIRPATLAIVVSPIRDSRLIIGLINEGQIFRFLLEPPIKELLRRGLIAALERHAELISTSRLQARHAVEVSSAGAESIAGRLLSVWRRVREATFARQ